MSALKNKSKITKVKYSGSCSLYVEGMDMNCPVCKVLVKSMDRHVCGLLRPKKDLKP